MSETKTFADLGVDPRICTALESAGITTPFPIQELTLPLALAGADVIGQARTGTGKTLGFGIPMLQRVDLEARETQVLVIVPTRELCLQVTEDLVQAGRERGVTVVAVYGGKAIAPQADAVRDGAHVVVGTPGRLLDLLGRGFLRLGSVRGLVLDEADEMLDLGFLPDVERLVQACAEERQTLLFSATMPAAVVQLARRYMSHPTFLRAEVEEVRIAPETRQFFFSCHRMDKPAVLARILQTPQRKLAVVFVRTKRMADILVEELESRGVSAGALHSDRRQEARERTMERFRSGKVDVLVATEVAARGLDIDDVTHVINYDCPDDEKMYLHRIGRTGRAGAAGCAVTLALWNELARLNMVRRDLDIDEPVHEVFSTSPLLDELFDLPPRESAHREPASPAARGPKPARSSRRAGPARDAEATAPADTRPVARVAADQGGDGGAAPAVRRTRRRTRPDGGAEAESSAAPAATTPGTGPADAAPEAGQVETTTTTRTAVQQPVGGEERRRVRSRTRRVAPTTALADAAPREESATTAAVRDTGEAASGRQRRTRTRPGDPAPRSDRGSASRNRSAEPDGQPRGRGRSAERGAGTRTSARGGRGRRSSGGRWDGREGADRGARDRRSGPKVDVTVARDGATPRLTRKLEVVHLP